MKPTTFAARLQELLTEADISAYRLAQLSRVPQQTISRYLRGRSEPTIGNLLRIAQSLDKSLAVFDDVVVKENKENSSG